MKQTVLAIAAAMTVALPLSASAADPAAIARGKYLVTIAGCNDCHTPGYFFGKPDKATGLGNWTDAQVVAALQKGERPDGRMLAPIMPWHAFAGLTRQDVDAIV